MRKIYIYLDFVILGLLAAMVVRSALAESDDTALWMQALSAALLVFIFTVFYFREKK